jgi:hypothetical protein
MNPNKCAFGVLAIQFLGFLIHEKGIEVGQKSVSATRKSFNHRSTRFILSEDLYPICLRELSRSNLC